jgi:hypothetical protein
MNRTLETATLAVTLAASGLIVFLAVQVTQLTKTVGELESSVEHLSEKVEQVETSSDAGRALNHVAYAASPAALSPGDLRAVAHACAEGHDPALVDKDADQPEESTPQETAQRATAIAQANAVIDQAADRGVWSNEDELELNRTLASLPSSEIEPVVARLARTINSGELVPRH